MTQPTAHERGIPSVFNPTQSSRVMATFWVTTLPPPLNQWVSLYTCIRTNHPFIRGPGSSSDLGPSLLASSVLRQQARSAHTSQPSAVRDRTTWRPDMVNARRRSWFASIQEHGGTARFQKYLGGRQSTGTGICTHQTQEEEKSKDVSPTHYKLCPKKKGKKKRKVKGGNRGLGEIIPTVHSTTHTPDIRLKGSRKRVDRCGETFCFSLPAVAICHAQCQDRLNSRLGVGFIRLGREVVKYLQCTGGTTQAPPQTAPADQGSLRGEMRCRNPNFS
ncbi:uncharacterized protein LY79DRAFT_188456 [Colletotrichum navitas]|uniref:Uncharacterized protein n=1 Tax=Colletotrichum navitas TaxID=681940 RepID=A0AAD8V516_9PEZI|nr:uncharacterized protein LY79DRAFT_188456 [Colletotrichum navitas]KAK1593134.1 hypothetical protein LY79DRAFT_188456 [Colletotrichum navitas]